MVALTSVLLLLSVAIISTNRNSVYSLPAGASPIIIKDAVEDLESHPQYTYEYAVRDDATGDNKHQHETRNGDVVSGQYSLLEPDGSRRTVDYTADPVHGFNAVVTKHADVEEEHLPLVKPLKTVVEPVKYAAYAPVTYKYSAPIKTARIYTAAPVKTVAYTAAPYKTVAYTAPLKAHTIAYTSSPYTSPYTAHYTAPYTTHYTSPYTYAAYTAPVTRTAAAVAYTSPVVSHAAPVVSHAPVVAAYAAQPIISHTSPAYYTAHSIYH